MIRSRTVAWLVFYNELGSVAIARVTVAQNVFEVILGDFADFSRPLPDFRLPFAPGPLIALV